MQAAHVEQVADERVEPVRVLLDGGQQVGLVGFGPLHVGLPQAADRRLDRGQRGAQVVTDRGEQRGPHPVAFGECLGLGRLSAQPVAVQGGRRLGGVPGQQGRRGRGGLPGDHQGQVVADVDAVGCRQHAVHPARRGPYPPAAHPFLQFGLAAVGPGEVLEHGRGGVAAAEHGLGQLEQRGRLLPGPGGLHGAPGGQVDHAADGDRDRHEQQQGQQFARLLDGERVDRLGEVPVEQEAGRDGGEHGGPEAADHRGGHHRDQVHQDEVGQVQVRPPGRQDHGEQWQQDRGQQHARQPPPDPDRGTGSHTGRGIGRLGLGVISGTAPHAGSPAHAYQCEPSVVPAEHQAEDRARQRARGHDHCSVHGGRPGGPQLRVGRPGEPDHGEPADAGQQHRRDRFGRERHAEGDHGTGDQDPAGRQPAVQRGGHRAHGQEHGEAGRQRIGRRRGTVTQAITHLVSYFSPANGLHQPS